MSEEKNWGLIGPPGAYPDQDQLTEEAGARPVGSGVGVGGTATGSILGAAIGGLIGAAVGSVLAGSARQEEGFSTTEEDAYWRVNYCSRPYCYGRSYDDFRPAYRYGWENGAKLASRRWQDVESDLERDWEKVRDDSSLSWHEAKHAVRDAWDRIEYRRLEKVKDSDKS